MASHQLIENYLAELGTQLPDHTVEELADGLYETWQHHLKLGVDPDGAAQAALAEFGTTQQINDAFVASAPGRRTARILLATGPVFGIWWGLSLITAKAWTWPVPAAAGIGFAATLLGVVACLGLAATSLHRYRRTRLGNIGGVALILLDAAMITAVLLAAPHLVWPMAIAIPASLVRISLTLRSLPTAQRFRHA